MHVIDSNFHLPNFINIGAGKIKLQLFETRCTTECPQKVSCKLLCISLWNINRFSKLSINTFCGKICNKVVNNACSQLNCAAVLTYLDLVPPVLIRTLGDELSPSGPVVGSSSILSRHSHQHPVCPYPPSVCLAMSSLVFRPSSCHLLVSTLWPD